MTPLLQQALSLPELPGCYLMKSEQGVIIYVGKAKNLRSRVSSYFNNSAKNLKTLQLVSRIHTFEFMITQTEVESLVLENNLIKNHKPYYNVRLKDDKSYPYVQINWNEPFPRLEYTRQPKKMKGLDLWGPFPPGSNIFLVLKILTKTYGLRDCSLSEFKSRKTPCLLFQMRQCSAPCVGFISENEYLTRLKFIASFFQGRKKAEAVISDLEIKMMNFGELEEFEQASVLRDHIQILKEFLSKSFNQQVESLSHNKDIDFWSYFVGDTELDISLYFVRSGMLLGQKNFHFLTEEILEDLESSIQSKILQYYTNLSLIPATIVLDFPLADLSTISPALINLGVKEVQGQSKKYTPVLDMTKTNAQETQRVRQQNQTNPINGLLKLQDLLNLSQRPKVLECYDIAIWQGQSPTAAQIVFEEGLPLKTHYRYYHLTPRPEGNNDFAMLQEVITRRIKAGNLPEVLIIDGGLGQINAVKEILTQHQLDIPMVGIAKAKTHSKNFKELDISKSEERLVFLNGSEWELKNHKELFKIIVNMRDEAHRFSRKLHHHAESKRTLHSWVTEVAGLTSTDQKAILTHLTKSQVELHDLSLEDLQKELSLETKVAKKLFKHFHPN